jgi:o-succinylbenzoate synthase
MRIRSARLDELELELVEPFETSFGVEQRRRFLLLVLESRDGLEGYGECVAARFPLYSSETVATAREMLVHHFLPRLFRLPHAGPIEFRAEVAGFRGHRMAKATVENALVDLAARSHRLPISRYLGGHRRRVEVGVSVGIQRSPARLVRRVGAYLDDGYRRIKLKVRPGWDAGPVGAVRRSYPDVTLWVDANQAYPTRAAPRIRRWATALDVAQVEQPFAERAIRAHAELARGASFRVCLDESIIDAVSLDDALAARAVTSLNVKVGRVGGPLTGAELARTARRAGVPSWIGGMLESGIGRAHNVHLASLAPFTLPADLSASDRYYTRDLIDPPFELGPGSTLSVPTGPGLGVAIDTAALRRARRSTRTYRP